MKETLTATCGWVGGQVGKMELFSSAFQRQVAACLDSTDLLVLGR